MPDDSQFDPLAGIITPQSLQIQRMLQMQQLYGQAAQTAGSGRDFGARALGLSLGGALGQNSTGGGMLDQLAQQNAGILNAPSTGASTGNPYEDRAQAYESKARMFLQAGQYEMAQKFVSAAQIAGQQGLSAEKTQAETFEAKAKGVDSLSHTNTTPQVGTNPATGKDEYFRVGPDGQPQWLGVPARPQVPQANITLNQEKPFLGQFAGQLDKNKAAADDAATSLGMIRDLRTKINAGIISGTGADARTQFGTVLQTLGFNKGGNNPVANTQAFAAETLQMALLNRPAGQRLTQTEWNALKGMAGGDTNITQDGIKQILRKHLGRK